jgi:hypothetical protein
MVTSSNFPSSFYVDMSKKKKKKTFLHISNFFRLFLSLIQNEVLFHFFFDLQCKLILAFCFSIHNFSTSDREFNSSASSCWLFWIILRMVLGSWFQSSLSHVWMLRKLKNYFTEVKMVVFSSFGYWKSE